MAATAVNRADTLQRQGFYPPPPGASDVLGLECSGVVSAVGAGVDGWSVGDEVCALLAGGGYAEKVLVPAGQVMPVPAGRRPGDRRRAARGRLHGVVERVHDRRAAAGRDAARARRRAAASAPSRSSSRTPLGARVITTAGLRRRSSTSAASLGADVTINYQRAGLRRGGRRGHRRRRRRRDPRQHGREVPRPQRRGAGHRGPAGGDRHAGRHQGRARPRGAAAQARRGHRHLAAGPAGRGEGRDLRVGRRARLAAGRRRHGAARSCTRRCRSRRPARRTGSWRPATTSARSCSRCVRWAA